ncbi:N-acetyl-gamma-glutamyl-phosphate reductase [Fuchsiella alkaliacetigena]|uniref:N-acetyl-gamma-glutamyl-phosphate reductase n=1 Tax=Fuchsiella alkaliacetigena TaxID=957042 RepID=UPI00200B6B36|nr:N-acetyl-gamma-glutamyl-phosphate reductase [Fuchsiella alkaliacetigena]MCK8823467.1 N-acetyl-gamma-glutamyl-phosphate reductase [Fuchsiella alkaliacetigena]
MTKVGIVGATGYTGAELARLLANHPQVELELLTSRSFVGQQLSDIYANLKGIVDLECESLEAAELAKRVEIVFAALPHGVSMNIVPELLAAGLTVIDLSGDYRYHSQEVYEQWYEQSHQSPELIGKAVYGLPELNKSKIKSSSLVANPGCYPTSAILALAPAVEAGVIDLSSIIVDAKSGVTGAGRGANRVTHFVEANENFRAYKVAEHRHTSEIEMGLETLVNNEVVLSFTPHLVPMKRGILSTIYAQLTREVQTSQLLELYRDFYRDKPFVRLQKEGVLPATKNVTASNFCDLGLKVDQRTGRVVIVSAIDNLGKGASGQAVQNLNLILDCEETLGLEFAGIFP